MFASGLEKNVCYERNRFMEKADNEMYALVDEEFLAKFSNQHLNYMKKLYYSFYAGYCKRIKRKPLTSEDFFKNMHLRRFQLYQLCCPYCGTVSLCIHDKKESKTAGYNFCHSCGRTSTLKNLQKHLARFVRIKRMNRIISNLYLKEYYQRRNRVIANYYFNKENAYDFFADME